MVNEVVDEQSLSICRTVGIEEVATSISNALVDDVARLILYFYILTFL